MLWHPFGLQIVSRGLMKRIQTSKSFVCLSNLKQRLSSEALEQAMHSCCPSRLQLYHVTAQRLRYEVWGRRNANTLPQQAVSTSQPKLQHALPLA